MRAIVSAVVLAMVVLGLFWVLRGQDTADVPVEPRHPVGVDTPAAADPPSAGTAGARIEPGGRPELPRSLVAEESLDLTGDGTPDRVRLYVDAERGPDGQLHWDDGQRWLLLVGAAEGDYVLFDEYVQIGQLRFWVIEEDGVRAPRLLLMRETGAGLELRSFRFAPGAGFSSTREFAVTGNVVYTSPQAR